MKALLDVICLEECQENKLNTRQIFQYIQYRTLKNSLIINEENTKKNHKRVVSVFKKLINNS